MVRHFLLRSIVLLCAYTAFLAHAQIPTDPTRTGELMSALPGTLSTPQLPSSAVTNASVGPGDILRVTVFGQPDLSAEVGINDKGIINLPLIGGLHISGLTTSQAASKISDTYREQQYLKNPEISVEVVQMRSQMVSILGEVSRPGRYPIPGKMSVLELLATAGGLTEQADSSVTLLRRNPDPNQADVRIPIQLGQNGTSERTTLDVDLDSGDVVYVNKKKLFYIHGEVNRPGAYPMEPDMNIMRAISLGGGLSVRGSTRRISIYRKEEDKEKQLSARMTDTVQAGDVVYIKESLF
jgi:polysaccharide export outer membrane protein